MLAAGFTFAILQVLCLFVYMGTEEETFLGLVLLLGGIAAIFFLLVIVGV